jgi:putative transposase
MSARANPCHNAWSESLPGAAAPALRAACGWLSRSARLIATLKTEMLQDGCFLNATDARTELFAFIEAYYNTHRKHSALAYFSPTQFEAKSSALN